MTPKNHVLLLTPGFPEDENDFLCTPPVQDFLIKFKQIFPDTHFSVIAFQYPYIRQNYKWNEIDVFALGGNNSSLNKLLIWKRAIIRAKNIHNNFPVTSIHSLWFGECTLVGNHLSKYFNCKHFCTLMGQDVSRSNKYLKFLNKNKVKIISLSENQSSAFYSITNRKIDENIFWGIDNQEFNVNDKREIDLLAVGSLIPLKNYSVFIRTISNIINTYPNIVCKLAGAGHELLMLRELAIQSGVDKNIEFLGLISRNEIFNLMKRSKIFFHPSKFEGSGFVFAEALVNGMNIISYNVGYAKPSNKWFIAKDENDFTTLTKTLLSGNLSFASLNLFPILETVNKYNDVYSSKIK